MGQIILQPETTKNVFELMGRAAGYCYGNPYERAVFNGYDAEQTQPFVGNYCYEGLRNRPEPNSKAYFHICGLNGAFNVHNQ